MYLRSHKGDGPKAWEVLQAKYKSYERPRLQQLVEKLTSLRKLPSENITEFICRAEACQYELKQVGEAVTEKMLVAMVLKGLPREYETFVTLVKFSCESKSLDEIKRDLINFESDRKMKIKGDVSDSVLYVGKPTRIKCYKCNETKQSIVATKIVFFAPTVTRKVILPKTVEPNDMATKKTVTKVIVGFAHGVKEMAIQCKTVSRKTKQ